MSNEMPTAWHCLSVPSVRRSVHVTYFNQAGTASFLDILVSPLVFRVSREAHLCLLRSLPTQRGHFALAFVVGMASTRLSQSLPFLDNYHMSPLCKTGAPTKQGQKMPSIHFSQREERGVDCKTTFPLNFILLCELSY